LGPRTIVFTLLALIAFAANSLLCRAALATPDIDAASFASIRTVAGAVVLLIIVTFKQDRRPRGDFPSAIALAVYMTGFAHAYLSLSTGTGALILFAAVQITMLGAGLVAGERLHATQWFGLAAALAGLVWLLLPGAAAPSLDGAALMILAGVGWGIYSLRGRGVVAPLQANSGNFLRAVPLVLLAGLPTLSAIDLSRNGVLLAVASGALASALGYAVWYAALPQLAATHAAIVQLAVPVLAALGGVVVLSEQATPRLLVAGAITLGGVGLAIAGRRRWRVA
jgi:drug/metabolite transporter (DMT)-like permease